MLLEYAYPGKRHPRKQDDNVPEGGFPQEKQPPMVKAAVDLAKERQIDSPIRTRKA